MQSNRILQLPKIDADPGRAQHGRLRESYKAGPSSEESTPEEIDVLKKFLKELHKAMKGTKWFDKSDIMTDYFHTAYYIDINIGKWSKPYVKVGG